MQKVNCGKECGKRDGEMFEWKMTLGPLRVLTSMLMSLVLLCMQKEPLKALSNMSDIIRLVF